MVKIGEGGVRETVRFAELDLMRFRSQVIAFNSVTWNRNNNLMFNCDNCC